METIAEQKDFYSIDKYQGPGKWCFAIVLNRAYDNYGENPHLFSESLLVFERTTRKDWFDEEIRELIERADTETKPNPNLKPNTPANRKLTDIRNYFSHFSHKDGCLYFKEDEPIRIIMEKAYEKAKEEVIKHLKKETDIIFPDLFESSGRITSAGVVFLASIFVERRILSRLLGYVSGFKKSEGEYNITRKIFSTYCLKDSYSIHTPDPKAVLFRDILGYLSRVPSEYYPTYLSQIAKRKPGEKSTDDKKYSERKTDKFILFALKYLEEFVLNGLANYAVSIGRKQIVREEIKVTEDEQHKPYPSKSKVKVVFDSNKKELPYYIEHSTVILQIQRKQGKVHFCKMGVSELKYFVLLCLRGEAEKAVAAIDGYIHRIQNRFANPSTTVGSGEDEQFVRGLPEFVRVHSGIKTQDEETEKNRRLDYIRKKWDKKKKGSPETELHRKGRDILRYINWNCKQPLGVDKYNQLLALLVNKDFAGFGVQLYELKRTEKLSEQAFKELKDISTLNALHIKVCDLVLAELEHLEKNDPAKLAEYIGLVKEVTDKTTSYEDKVKAFVKQPMIYKGFLRDSFFKQAGKTFAKLVEETLLQKFRYPDVPLGGKYYHLPALDRFHKDNSILYETLALDRLCAMMARACYTQINKNLAQKAEEIVWHRDNGKETIILKLRPKSAPHGRVVSIRFSVTDYTKLYVMDDAEFLGGLVQHFFPNEQSIEYHRLYSGGINKYTAMQKDGIEVLLRLEEKIIRQKNIDPEPGKNYISFREIMAVSRYDEDSQKILTNIRNALLHYNLKFEPADYIKFVEIMKREGLESKKKTRKTTKK